MTHARVLAALATADPGSAAYLSAVEWLCKRDRWELCDELLAEREQAVAAEQARLAAVRSRGRGGNHGTAIPWTGPRKHEMEDAA